MKKLLLVVALITSAAVAQAQSFVANMNGAQDGGGARQGTGTVNLTLSGTTLTLVGIFSGLTTNATAAHIHGPAGPGTNAGVIYPLGVTVPLGVTSGAINGSVTLADIGPYTVANQIADLNNGRWYLNIHNAPFPGGEIRGQIVAPSVAEIETVVIGGTTVLSVTNIGESRVVTDLLTGQTVITGTLSATTTVDQITFSLPPGKVVTSGTLVISNYVAAVPLHPFTEFENGLYYSSLSSQPYAYSDAVIYANGTNSITAPTKCAATNFTIELNAPFNTSGFQDFFDDGMGNMIPFIFGQETSYGSASYVITLTIGDAETVSTLTNLTSANAMLSPAFASGTTNYSATIPASQTFIQLTPSWSSQLIHTTMKVNGDAEFAVGSGGFLGAQMSLGTNTVVFKVCAQDGDMTIYTVTVVRLSVAPTVTAIAPDSGSTAGGERVTITGTNFTGATAVTIGGVAATGLVVSNNTTLSALTPAHAVGVVDVVVTTPGGSGTGTNLFTYIVFPAGTDKMIAIKAGATYTFSPEDWGFSDGDSPADAFARVKLTTLPNAGTLKVEGVEAMAGEFVAVQRGAAGETWTPRGSEGTWTSIASSADGNKLAVAGIGYPIQISTNCGVTWTAREREYHWTSIASSADGTKLAAVTRLNYIYTSTDSGETWTPRETPRNWESIASSADGCKLAAVESTGSIYTSTNCGVDWTVRDVGSDHALAWADIASSADGSKLAALASNDNIYTSTNCGVDWTEQPGSGARRWTSIASSADGSKLAAVAVAGFIYTSTNCGVDWTERETERNWVSITSSADGRRLAAVVNGGQIYTSTDCGETWTAHESDRGWTSIASSADGTKLAAAVFPGKIYTSAGLVPLITYTAPADGPASFTFQVEDSGAINNLDPSPNTITFLVEPNTPPVGTDKTNTIYAGETFFFSPEDWGFTDSDSPPNAFARVKLTTLPDGGTLKVEGVDAMAGQFVSMLRGPAGEEWDTAPLEERSWRSVASSADGTKLAAVDGDRGYIYTSTDCGLTWTRQEGAGDRYWRAIASSADGAKLAAVVGNEYIYTSTDCGVTWTRQVDAGERTWRAIASSADGTKLAAVEYGGYIYTSTDCGVTWTRQEDAGERTWTSIASAADGTKLAAVEDGDEDGGYIYTSTDCGVTWTRQEDAGERTWTSIASSADGTKLAAVEDGNGEGGFIYTSTDSGETWTRQEDVGDREWTSIASSADGTRLAAVTDGSRLYTSTDSGEDWNRQRIEHDGDWTSIASSADGTKLVAVENYGAIWISLGYPVEITYRAPTNGTFRFTFQVEDDGFGHNLDLTPRTITFNVLPNDAPVLTLPASPLLVSAPDASGTTVEFEVTATDTEDGPLSPSVNPGSGSFFALGTTTVAVSATDRFGLTTTGSFLVTVCATNLTVTSTNDSGPGSLRQAIADLCPGGVIDFNFNPPAPCVMIVLTNGQLMIDKDMTILGPGPTNLSVMRCAEGAPDFRIFVISNGVAANISGLTIANGRVQSGSGSSLDGVSLQYEATGGGVCNMGALVLSNCVVSGNSVHAGGEDHDVHVVGGVTYEAAGGGIYNAPGASLTVIDCTVSNNQAIANGPPIGPAIYIAYGGGIANHDATLRVFSSTISGNTAGATNGATAIASGGGIASEDGGSVVVLNSTLSGNLASGSASGFARADGGGLWNDGSAVALTNVTVAGNRAFDTSGTACSAGGLFNTNVAGSLRLANTIVADNVGFPGPDLFGNFTSGGHNLIGNTNGGDGFVMDDLLSTNALLGPLANNGGPTLTHALLPGSPVINAGDPAFNTNSLPYDQRGPGFPRVIGGRVDIGAYETIDIDPSFGCQISRWRFDETNGVLALDSAGVNLGTLVNGPVRVPGRVGSGALLFDGVDDQVRVPDHPSLHLTTNWSVSMWFKPSQLLNASSGRRDLFQKFASYWLLFNFPANDGRLAFVFNTGSPILKSTTSSWPSNQWQHVAATYDGAMMRLYVNGVLEASTPTNVLPAHNTSPVEIGGGTLYRNFFRGCVDDVRIFCTNLAPATVQAIYDGSNTLPPPPPVNTPPVISDIPNVTLITNSSSLLMPFTVSDGQTTASNLVVTAVSDNPALLPNGNIFLADYVSNRVVRVTPAPNATGVATVTVTVSDGALSTNDTFTVNVTAPTPPTTGCLISHWNFEEPSGNTAFDVADSNPGTLIGSPVRAPGLSAAALYFNGVDNYVNVPDSNSLDLTNQFSISLWFKPNALLDGNSGRHDLLKKFLSYWFIFNYPGNDGKLTFVLNSGAPIVKSTTASWASGQWHHAVATYDGANLKLYVNGALEGSIATTVVPVKNTAPLQIGGNSDQGYYFSGGVDEVRIYGCALTAADISGLYTQGGATNPPPPLNTPPTISDISDRTIVANSNTGDIPFTVGDAQTSAGSLIVTATSTNTALVPNGNLQLGGSSGARTLRMTPVANLTGVTLITVTVSDGVYSTNDTFLLTVTNAPPPPPSGTNLLISRWQFDEGSGNNATDSFGPNLGTLVNSPSRVGGQVGSGALLFNGVNQHVNVPDGTSLDLSNRFTIAFWFKPSVLLNGTSGRKDLLQKFLSYWILLNYPANDGKIAFVLNSGNPLVKSTTASWASNQWYHLAATYDGVTMRLYINGVLEGSAPSVSLPANTTNPLQFGGNTTQPYWFPGAMDDVRLYGSPLSADAITSIMGGLSPLLPPAPAASPVISISTEPEFDLIVLKWSAQAGRTYRVEYTDDLAGGEWTPLPGEVTVTGASARAEDTLGLSIQRFYRVVVER